jgi:2-C-methyl-D-erythritol 4-phosphate cytidylyltransferase
MEHLRAAPPEVVVVHDGARPVLTTESVNACVQAALEFGAATVAVPLKDSLKEGDGKGFVLRSVPRARLLAVQTPQAFRWDWLMRAHETAAVEGWTVDDDAELIEKQGLPVRVVAGDYRNLKITTNDDLAVAELHLTEAQT